MQTKLDNEIVFDDSELQIHVGSWKRDCIERTAGGVDGVLSIDLGLRDRTITQKGTLRAASNEAMNRKIDSITAMIDGASHSLTTKNGEQFDNVRMDQFEILSMRLDGSGVCCEYKASYTQLGAN